MIDAIHNIKGCMTMCSDIQYQVLGYLCMYVCTCPQCQCAYTFIYLPCPIAIILGTRPITVLAQSTSVNITINGNGEVYTCTLNNQTMDITSGQTVQLTGLAPNTKHTVNCHSVNGSCLEARATFTTGTAYVYI